MVMISGPACLDADVGGGSETRTSDLSNAPGLSLGICAGKERLTGKNHL